MAWTTPRTWTSTVVTASDLNTDIRDNLNILKTRIANDGNPLFDRAGGAAKTTTYTVTTSDVLVDCGGSSNWTLTLYAASGNAGRVLFLRNTGTAVVTVDGNASETIDGATALKLGPGESMVLWCNGTAWFTVAEDRPTIVQRVFATFTTASSTTSTSYADLSSAISLAITPKFADSTIHCYAHIPVYAAAQPAAWRIAYGATPTQIAEGGMQIGGYPSALYGTFAPGSASAQTVKVQGKVTSGGTLYAIYTNGAQPNSFGWMMLEEVRAA